MPSFFCFTHRLLVNRLVIRTMSCNPRVFGLPGDTGGSRNKFAPSSDDGDDRIVVNRKHAPSSDDGDDRITVDGKQVPSSYEEDRRITVDGKQLPYSKDEDNMIIVANGRRVQPIPADEYVAIVKEIAKEGSRKVYDIEGCKAMKRVRDIMNRHGVQSQTAQERFDFETQNAKTNGYKVFESIRMYQNLRIDESVPGSNLKVITKKTDSNGKQVVEQIIPMEYYHPKAMEYISKTPDKAMTIENLRKAAKRDGCYMNFDMWTYLVPKDCKRTYDSICLISCSSLLKRCL